LASKVSKRSSKTSATSIIDKTQFAYDLIEGDAPHYFISRPRGFGKSLFLNTLKEIFSGNRDLFKGLAIAQSDYQWKPFPVLVFDFSQIANRTPEEFEASLKRTLVEMGAMQGLTFRAYTIREGVKALIVKLAERINRRIVVLTDEYDNPIINRLDNIEIASGNRELLKDFFGTLKSLDQYLKFTFTTGVSKFSQVSLFSGPNNIKDITMDPRYAAIMGYTEEEIKIGFALHIQRIAHKHKRREEEILLEVCHWYNGYRFSKGSDTVYNPFSTLNFMDLMEVMSYWYSTGTPSFLIEEIRRNPQALIGLSGSAFLLSTLSDISKLDRIHLPTLMFQTGYLTIKDYNPQKDVYTLDFPNQEVRGAFFNSLLQEFAEIEPLEVISTGEELRSALTHRELNRFFELMNIHLAKIPYHPIQQ
jgi:hypothetical protein